MFAAKLLSRQQARVARLERKRAMIDLRLAGEKAKEEAIRVGSYASNNLLSMKKRKPICIEEEEEDDPDWDVDGAQDEVSSSSSSSVSASSSDAPDRSVASDIDTQAQRQQQQPMEFPHEQKQEQKQEQEQEQEDDDDDETADEEPITVIKNKPPQNWEEDCKQPVTIPEHKNMSFQFMSGRHVVDVLCWGDKTLLTNKCFGRSYAIRLPVGLQLMCNYQKTQYTLTVVSPHAYSLFGQKGPDHHVTRQPTIQSCLTEMQKNGFPVQTVATRMFGFRNLSLVATIAKWTNQKPKLT